MGFSLLFQTVVVNFIKNEMNKNDMNSLSLLVENSEQVLKRAWANAVSLSMDPRMEQLLNAQPHSTLTGAANVEYVSAVLELLVVLRAMNDVDELIHSFYIYNAKTGMLITSRGESLPVEEYFDTGWLLSYEKGQNRLKYLPSRRPVDRVRLEDPVNSLDVDRDIYSDVITLLFPLSFHPYQSLEGAVVVNLIERNLLYKPEGDEESLYFILDKEGELLSHASSSEEEILRTIASLTLNESSSAEPFEINFQGKQHLVSTMPNEGNGLIFVKMTPLAEFYALIRNLQYLILALGLFFLAAGSLLAWRFTRNIHDPIRTTAASLKRAVGPGGESFDANELNQINQAVRQILTKDEEVHELLEKSRQDLTGTAVLDLIRGNTEKASVIFTRPDGEYYCIVLLINRFRHFAGRYSYGEQYTFRSLILRLALEAVRPYCRGAGVITGDDRITLILEKGEEDNPRLICQEILETITSRQSVPVVLSEGGVHQGWDAVRLSFLEAMEGLQYRISFPEGKSIIHSEPDRREVGYPDLDLPVRKILNHFQKGNTGDLSVFVDELTDRLFENQLLNYEQVLSLLAPLILGTGKILREAGVSDSLLLERHRSLYDLISDQESQDQLRQALEEYYLRAVTLLAEQESSLSATRFILKYLGKNFSNPNLDLTLLSAEAGLSYSHTRKLIKDETGCSFVDYLNRIRIDRAKGILSETGKPVREVASEVGYHNDQSFSRFFKKYEGISPGEFRKWRSGT